MKILVYAHRLEVGGTQMNAIELAAMLRDVHGFDLTIFAQPGPMAKLVEEKGLRFLPAPDARFHPSLARMRALREVVRSERPDVIHVWDWWQCLDAYYAVHLPMRIPMVVSDMMMDLSRILPKQLPTTFGIPELVDKARAAARRCVELMLPPVDVHHNSSDAVNSLPFRERYGIESGDITLVTVSRLSDWMKAESLIRTIDVIGTLGRDFPLRLLIVGDGSARAKLQLLADKTNADLKRSAVVLTGAMLDPRPAYAASDIVIGMGGSALRGMAFGKPVVIVGDQGFALPLTPDTAYSFYYHGIYGRGDGCSSNEHFVSIIRELADNPGQILSLGKFSREFILSHYSLETASARLAELCHRAAREALPLHITAIDGLRTTAIYLRERRFLTPSRDNAPIDMISSLHLPNKVRSSVDPCDTELS